MDDNDQSDDSLPQNILAEERLQRWLGITTGQPPEWIASHADFPAASWVVVTEDGPDNDRQRRIARLKDERDLPYWAFALAKSYLDDVGEWPLFGMQAENALDAYEAHGDVCRAVTEILASVRPVWPEVTVLFAGKEPQA